MCLDSGPALVVAGRTCGGATVMVAPRSCEVLFLQCAGIQPPFKSVQNTNASKKREGDGKGERVNAGMWGNFGM